MPEQQDGREFAFESVVVERGGVLALDGFTARVPGKGTTVLFGPSGSGKSTVLRLCNRLEVPTRGRVRYGGRDVAELDPLQLRREVGMVFQRPTPFPGTVRDNLLVAVPDATDAMLRDALDRSGLEGDDWCDRDATALSGGEAQRVCVARTLLTEPDVLLLDEPTSALDEAATAVLERTFRKLADAGLSVLWVTHDATQAERVADRILRVEEGACAGWAGSEVG